MDIKEISPCKQWKKILIFSSLCLLCFVGCTTQSAKTANGSSQPSKSSVFETPLDTSEEDLSLQASEREEDVILYSTIGSKKTYLLNEQREIVHTWTSSYRTGSVCYLLENGNLLYTGKDESNTTFQGGAEGGIVEELDWESNVVWSYSYSSDQYLLHHDIQKLPNGHILMVAWEMKDKEASIQEGRNPSLLSDGELWPDALIEIDPTTNETVWQWHVWDHLIQSYDASKDNYGDVSSHPELIDVNYVSTGKLAKGADWTHINAIDYNEDLDQILISSHSFNEIWVIDHSTTTAEAASHRGGTSGMGGDLLYRYGNPATYEQGARGNQQLFGQHSVHWIDQGLPGAGDILIFNNGAQREKGVSYSSVDERSLPVSSTGTYTKEGNTFSDAPLVWTYTAEDPTSFFSRSISGAQRLSDGNTLICNGEEGVFFEVTDDGEIVWRYENKEKSKHTSVFRVTAYPLSYEGLAALNG